METQLTALERKIDALLASADEHAQHGDRDQQRPARDAGTDAKA